MRRQKGVWVWEAVLHREPERPHEVTSRGLVEEVFQAEDTYKGHEMR